MLFPITTAGQTNISVSMRIQTWELWNSRSDAQSHRELIDALSVWIINLRSVAWVLIQDGTFCTYLKTKLCSSLESVECRGSILNLKVKNNGSASKDEYLTCSLNFLSFWWTQFPPHEIRNNYTFKLCTCLSFSDWIFYYSEVDPAKSWSLPCLAETPEWLLSWGTAITEKQQFKVAQI